MRMICSALGYALNALLCVAAWPASAQDIAIVDHEEVASDRRREFSRVVLRAVLARTTNEFGPYKIKESPRFMERPRMLNNLKSGEIINIAAMPATAEWMHALPYVPIPIDLGLQSWRLLLTDARTQPRLLQLAKKGKLAQAQVGVGATWALRGVLEENGYRTVKGSNYEGLFLMLKAGRFDYIPRTITEVFDEYDNYHAQNPGMVIDESIVLYARVPLLFFISPQNERLRQRVSAGLGAMLKDGSLTHLVLEYYRADLLRARLCGRIRIDISNNSLDRALLERRELWLDPFELRHGICPPRGH